MKISYLPYYKAFHASSIPMALSTIREGRYLDVNRACSQAVGLTSEEMIGRTSTDIGLYTEPTLRDRISESVVRNGSAGGVEMNFRCQDTDVTALVYFDRLGDDDEYWLTSALDLSPLKQEEFARQQVQNQLEAIRIVSQREEERFAIARDLHDDLSQELTGMHMELASLSRTVTDPVLRETLAALKEQMGRVVGNVRNILSELRSDVLDDLGLVGAIDWLVGNLQQKSGIPCMICCEEQDMHLPPSVTTAAYRIVQESFNNIARHSQATSAKIIMARSEDLFCMTIEDNGRGFCPADSIKSGHYGISGMKERACLCGGTVEVASQPGCGTSVTFCGSFHSGRSA